MAQYLHKGSLVGVEGRIQTRNYDDANGRRVYVTEVVAESVQFLEPKSASANRDPQPYSDSLPISLRRDMLPERRITEALPEAIRRMSTRIPSPMILIPMTRSTSRAMIYRFKKGEHYGIQETAHGPQEGLLLHEE